MTLRHKVGWWPDSRDTPDGVIDIPEGGGWLVRFYDGNGMYTPVFVPNVQIWADTLAASVAAALDARRPVAVSVDTSVFADVPQQRPNQSKGIS
jgi:hypothetical protein